MKNLNLRNAGVEELNANEMQTIDGGLFLGTKGELFKVLGNLFANLGATIGGIFNW